jgi:hypothetical protein
MQAQSMKDRDNDSPVSAALATHVGPLSYFHIRQTRRGWLQECLGCEARTELMYYKGNGTETSADIPREQQTLIATSLEDASCMCRFCCPQLYRKCFVHIVKLG